MRNLPNNILTTLTTVFLFVSVTIAATMIAKEASAQVMSLLPADKQAAYLSMGLDSGLLTTVGYARGIKADVIKRDIILSAELAIPAGDFDLGDYRFKIGAQTSIVSYKGWDLSIPIHINLIGTENWIHRATSIGGDASALFGYYADRWFLNLEFGYNVAVISKLTATDRYKKYYYSEFKDGWYSNAGGYFTRGIRVGFRIKQTEMTLRVGQSFVHTDDVSGEMFPPF